MVIRGLGGFRFQLLEDLMYTDLRGVTYGVPVNSVTDFASSWIGQYSFLPRQFLVCESAVLHDRLYQTHEVERTKADFLFREALNSQNATGYIQFKAFRGVRIFGKRAWDNYTDLIPII